MIATSLPRLQGEEGSAFGGPSLLAQFQEFHLELCRVRAALTRSDQLVEQGKPAANPADFASEINRYLRLVLDSQAAAVARLGGATAVERYRDAQYLMVALADEMLLHHEDWSGRDHWMENLLELSLFGSRLAGEQVFQRIDALLESHVQPHPDLLSIYLSVLSLGFRGQYYRAQDDARLRWYRTALADRLKQIAGMSQREEVPRLCPEAYAATVTEGRAVQLPHLRPWVLGGLAILLIYTAVAHGVWHFRTENVRTLAAPVKDNTHQLGQAALPPTPQPGGVR